MSKTNSLVLGVDGGGTKTVAWLACADGGAGERIIGRGISGSSNICDLGATLATDNLRKAIDAAFDDAGRERNRVASVCLALAGSDRDAEREAIRAWAERIQLADRLQVVHDAMPVLYSAAEDGCGIALISGTGSFAFGRNEAGATARCGGWGYLFGDEGSGYAIARKGLRAAARMADGRGPQTELLEMFLNYFGLQIPSQLISTIYSGSFDRTAIAGHSQVVFRAADASDAVAMAILRQASRDLAELIAAIASTLGLASNFALGLTGGVLIGREDVRAALIDELRGNCLEPTPTIVADPVFGAVRIAGQALLGG